LTQHLRNPVSLAILAVSLFYLLQPASPLRLNTDAVTLLSMAASAEKTGNFYPDYDSSRYPLGYPFTILQMGRLGLANSQGFIFLNLLGAAVMLTAFAKIDQGAERQRRFSATAIVVLLTLLSFTVIKHITVPLSDFLYLIFAYLALYGMHQILHSKTGQTGFKAWHLGSATCILLALSVRNAGVSLIPVFLLAILSPKGTGQLTTLAELFSHLNRKIVSLVLVLSLIVTGVLASVMSQQTMFVDFFTSKIAELGLTSIWSGRLTELGELLLNVPSGRLGGIPGSGLWLTITGLVVASLLVFDLWSRRSRWDLLDWFFMLNVALLLVWPHHDARFWIPVLPILLRNFLTAVESLWPQKLPRWSIAIPMLLHVTGGMLALAYSSWLSLSGKEFALRYGSNAELKRSYLEAFDMPASPDVINVPASATKVALLRKFDTRYCLP
jgi:hypothetical protein